MRAFALKGCKIQRCRTSRIVGQAATWMSRKMKGTAISPVSTQPLTAVTRLSEYQGGKCSSVLVHIPGAQTFPSQLCYSGPLCVQAAHLGSVLSSLHALIPVSPLSTALTPHEWSPEGQSLTPEHTPAQGAGSTCPFALAPGEPAPTALLPCIHLLTKFSPTSWNNFSYHYVAERK